MAVSPKLFIIILFFLGMVSPLIFLNANAYIEEKAYLLKWRFKSMKRNSSWGFLIEISFAVVLIVIVLYIFDCLKKKPLIGKGKPKAFTNLITENQYNQNKKIETHLALKRLENSREYQNYLKDKKQGKYNEIVLEEDEKIKFSDED